MADELFRNIFGRLLKMSVGQDVLIGGNELDGRRWGKGEEARRLPKASCVFSDHEIKSMLKFND